MLEIVDALLLPRYCYLSQTLQRKWHNLESIDQETIPPSALILGIAPMDSSRRWHLTNGMHRRSGKCSRVGWGCSNSVQHQKARQRSALGNLRSRRRHGKQIWRVQPLAGRSPWEPVTWPSHTAPQSQGRFPTGSGIESWCADHRQAPVLLGFWLWVHSILKNKESCSCCPRGFGNLSYILDHGFMHSLSVKFAATVLYQPGVRRLYDDSNKFKHGIKILFRLPRFRCMP